jgi:hypothetical protein
MDVKRRARERISPVQTRFLALSSLALEATFLTVILCGGLALAHKGAPVFVTLVMFIMGIVGIGYLSINNVVVVVRGWRDAQRQDESPGPAWHGLGPLIGFLCAAIVFGAAFYVICFCKNHWSTATVIEGLNYSVQTATTVGYGNWAPPAIAFTDPILVTMKEFSLFLMLSGVTFWSVLVGVLTTWYQSQ